MGDMINGRTPEEIKRGIKCHVSWGDCSTECPYDDVRNKPAHECIQSMTKDALALIERLEAKQLKWISVKERLPEAEEMYIVYIPLMGEVVAADYLDGHWIDWEVDLTEHVTHWMPLPEPPKEETHETTD